MKKFILALAAGLLAAASPVHAEKVQVKYHKEVSLDKFDCTDTTDETVRRVCYDKVNSYLVIKLQDTYYHYCAIGGRTIAALLSAKDKELYYERTIQGRFDCRRHHIPDDR